MAWRVYAGEHSDPSLADRWERDARNGGLAGRLQHGYLTEAFDALADFDAAGTRTDSDARTGPAWPVPRPP